MNIGERIRESRKVSKLTQQQLADLCGISDSYVSRIETGDRVPPRKTLDIIFESLGIKDEGVWVVTKNTTVVSAGTHQEARHAYRSFLLGQLQNVIDDDELDELYLKYESKNLTLPTIKLQAYFKES